MYIMQPDGTFLIPRGESLTLPLFINAGTRTAPVRFLVKESPGCAVYLGIIPVGVPFEEAVIKKRYLQEDAVVNQYGDILVTLDPADTLKLLPGTYNYVIKLKLPEGIVDTILPAKRLQILN